MRRPLTLAVCAMLLMAAPSRAAPQFDPKPWLDDLDQMHRALDEKYANLEWAASDRGANLDDYFGRARNRILKAQDAGDAKAAFEGLIRRLGDGHVEIEWPQTAASPAPSTTPADVCAQAGFDSAKAAPPLAASMKGYVSLFNAQSSTFPAGIVTVGGRRLGVLEIGLFSPEGFPELCREALQQAAHTPSSPCDEACTTYVENWAAQQQQNDFTAQVQALERAGIDALLVDVTGDGGGSEWAEVAARVLTPIRLVSEHVDFIPGAQWSKEFAAWEKDLRDAAKTASADDRTLLLGLADQAKAKRKIAETPCDPDAILKGGHPRCRGLGEGFYASGLLASADPATLRGKPWAATVFTPMAYGYSEGQWHGPLIVLVDGETWSASEEFAAVLQDNHAALIVGEPTGGAGCGHTDGSEPVVLSNSKGQLSLPDCARIRADGTNEVRGIAPDISVPWRRHDGPARRAEALFAKLSDILTAAEVTPRHK
jgi:peptidase S41-like protein